MIFFLLINKSEDFQIYILFDTTEHGTNNFCKQMALQDSVCVHVRFLSVLFY